MTRDGVQNSAKLRGSHRKARQSRSLPVLERPPRETPYQDYYRIKRMVQEKADLKGELTSSYMFVDVSFPPDRSSLTYVYSGDDKYECTVFRRAKEIKDEPSLTGLGGICDEPFPWQLWKQRGWFRAALVVVSLSVRALERLIPGFRNNEQNFDADYSGCFHFHVWRFGEWVDIVVDDYLPMLNDLPLFSRPLGGAGEMWGPLVEKAYAKCKKTFQAIEYGLTLDALTDLTGGVCEFFTPDIDPPSNLFHILYKSGTCRSFMTCWRNNKRLTPAGFNWAEEERGSDKERYLHIITAVTKFSISGGRMEQMIRLKCPYASEPKWQGRFSDGDSASWQNVNSEFMSRLQPLSKKDPDEYWMTYGDFRCNFGGLFIISSPEPFRKDGFNIQRTYRTQSDAGIHNVEPWTEVGYRNRGRRSTAPHENFAKELAERRTNSDSDCHTRCFKDPASAPCSPFKKDKGGLNSADATTKRRLFISKEKEHKSRVCADSTSKTRILKGRGQTTDQPHHRFLTHSDDDHHHSRVHSHESSPSSSSKHFSSSCLPSPRRRKSTGEKLKDISHGTDPVGFRGSCSISGSHVLKKTPKSNFMKKHSLDTTQPTLSYFSQQSASVDSTADSVGSENDNPLWRAETSSEASVSALPCPRSPSLITPEEPQSMSPIFNICPPTPARPETTDSCQSSSDISVHLASDATRSQKSSISTEFKRETSSGSLSSLTQSSFLATKADYFRSDGRWKIILEHRDIWCKDAPSSDRTRLDIHSRTQRVYFLVTRHEQRDSLVPPTLQEKRHVLISLLQDYRHGPSTANSLLVPIGFCLYRTKHSDRDEKKHISKLQLIGQVDGETDRREINARFDLDPGGYFLVPYYQAEQHQGEYLLRVLTESDVTTAKAGWYVKNIRFRGEREYDRHAQYGQWS